MFGICTDEGWLCPTSGPQKFFNWSQQPNVFPFRTQEGATAVAKDWLGDTAPFSVVQQGGPIVYKNRGQTETQRKPEDELPHHPYSAIIYQLGGRGHRLFANGTGISFILQDHQLEIYREDWDLLGQYKLAYRRDHGDIWEYLPIEGEAHLSKVLQNPEQLRGW